MKIKVLTALIASTIFVNPAISATNNNWWPVSQDELDAAVNQLNGQIKSVSNSIVSTKAELSLSISSLQEEVKNLLNDTSKSKEEVKNAIDQLQQQTFVLSNKMSHLEDGLNSSINRLQDQVTNLTNTVSHTYTLGEKVFGGTAIQVTPDGHHGLVMLDHYIEPLQKIDSWHQTAIHLNDPINYAGTPAQGYADWRLPSTQELLAQCAKGSAYLAEGRYWTNDIVGVKQENSIRQPYLFVNLVEAKKDFRTKELTCKIISDKTQSPGNPYPPSTRNYVTRPVRSF